MPKRLVSWLGLLIAFAGLATAQGGPPPPPERVFVLVVGVEDYADPKITDLAYTEDDAQAVYDFFAKSSRSPTIASRVKLLRGKQATRVGVLQEIRDHLVRQAVGPGDTAILYFAGHGFVDADGTYLATYDTKLTSLRYTSITWAELQREWRQISAGRRVLLADACHSGGLAGLRGFGGISKGGSLSLKKAPSRASVLIAATGANQLSVEDKKRKHGVFTASLLDGLGGAADTNRDSTVSLGELSAYLKLQVPQLAKQAGGNQRPTVSIRGSEAFAKRLVLGSGKARPKASATGELARVKAERLAAEKEREGADLRAKVAEARLEKLKGASAEERRKAQAELTQAKAQAAKAGQAVARLRAEESKRIAAEKRAAKAEAENAELRQQLAELKGKKAEAAKAKAEAEAARKKERELARKLAARPKPTLVPAGYAQALERAKRLKGFTYLDTKSFSCGGKTFKIARFNHAKTGLVFHLVPGGSYMRGAEDVGSAQPVMRVTVQPFLICATECTQAAWNRFMGKNPSRFKGARRPVEAVSWDESQLFVRAAGLRLPSEAEWEYACRAGSTSTYSYGGRVSELSRYAVYSSKGPKDVGTKLPNAFGLYDVHGNLSEWCQDAFANGYTGAPTDGSAKDSGPVGRTFRDGRYVPHSGPVRVRRGGHWLGSFLDCRSASRTYGVPNRPSSFPGIRPAKSLTQLNGNTAEAVKAARKREHAGKKATPSQGLSSYAGAIERAKRLNGFTYLDTKTFSCGGRGFTIARFSHTKTGLVFNLVPGGSYLRGSTVGRATERPVAKVTIQPFLVCATECTQDAWQRVTGRIPSRFKSPRRPVEQVSWGDTQSFARKAGLRLPSEAEWEYACRAGSTGAYCFGKSGGELKRYAVCFQGNKGTKDVATKLSNAFGLFDMHGNVHEWCQDAYEDSYTGAPADGSARDGASASKRVYRGGSWKSYSADCFSYKRAGHTSGYRDRGLGFRPAKSLP
jgi:formylglycine-generating enzyme required for sulfatase activity